MEPLLARDPKSIGDYTLIGRLGSGGMGIVYLAANGPDSVALKVIRESLLEDPSQATRFSREIETLKKINSPYVAKIINNGVTGRQAWYATEFVNGPDLKSLVDAKGPLKGDAWVSVANGLLQGISAIHAQGIIHRDIKPANVIVSESGPKIIDFGIAQVSDATSVTSTGLVAGTPAWFSPEQIEGKSLTAATDLFSAGSVLTYAATGKPPWGRENTITKAAVYGILVSEPDLRGLAPEQRRLVEGLLEKDPSARFRALDDSNVETDSLGVNSPKSNSCPPGKKLANENSRFEGRNRVGKGKGLLASLVFVGLAFISAILLTVPKLASEPIDTRLIVEMSFLEGFRGNAQAAVRIESIGDPPGIYEVTVQPLYPLRSDCPPKQLFNMGAYGGVRTFQGDVCVPNKDFSLQFSVSIRTNQGESASYLCQAENNWLSRRCSIT